MNSENNIFPKNIFEISRNDYKQQHCSLLTAHCSLFFLLLLFLNTTIIFSQSEYFFSSQLLSPYYENAPEINANAAVLIDAHTGFLLYSKNPDMEIPPASLTKLMTMHLVMKEIEAGRASYDEIIPITVHSWAQSQPPRSSLMFLEPGQIVTLREILLGLAVSSGNDAAVAAAMRIAPSVEEFARLMTAEARRMGLSRTQFVEASGISEQNMTTAAEFTHFSRQYIYLHPNSLKDFHSVQTFSYPMARNVPERYRTPSLEHVPFVRRSMPHTITQGNQNHLLAQFPGVDGLKTGFIEESGYNVALTAERNGTRFVGVILGSESTHTRNIDGSILLNWAFENFKTVRPVISQIEEVRLWKGKSNTAQLVLAHSADFTSLLNRANSQLKFETFIPAPLIAPLPAGAFAGYLIISDEYGELHRAPLVTASAYQRGNIFKRFWHSIRLMFQR